MTDNVIEPSLRLKIICFASGDHAGESSSVFPKVNCFIALPPSSLLRSRMCSFMPPWRLEMRAILLAVGRPGRFIVDHVGDEDRAFDGINGWGLGLS